MVYSGQLRSKSHTTHSSHQAHFEIYQNRIFAKSQPYTVEQKLAMAEIRGYTNCQWRTWGSLGHFSSSFSYLGLIVRINKIQFAKSWEMRLQRQRKARGREGEDAPQAKGTKKRQSQGRSPPFRVKGAEVCTSSPLVSQPIQGVGRGGQGYKGVQRRNKGGGSQLWSFLPVSD